MLKDPSNILNTKAPLQIAEDDEIIHSWISKLVIQIDNFFFELAI
jgi:hypothetical protein